MLLSKASRKVVNLEELEKVVAELRTQGRTVAHCHGVFDLLHVGHIRHFEEASKLADVLVVTITADTFVNKGPYRPAFTEALRAEALAALECIDYVAVNRAPTASPVIERIRPDVYVKGSDYKDATDDITGGIVDERRIVEAAGGRVAFTEDITFSSSSLLNKYLPTYSSSVNDYLMQLRDSFSASTIKAMLDELRLLRVLVVGEAIVDEYIYCDQLGKSAKDPVLAMRYESKEQFAGGSLAIANHLASFCESVALVSFLGAYDSRERFVRDRLAPNVRPTFLYKKESPTIVKRRYVESYLMSKLFEVYIINDEQLEPDEDNTFCSLLESELAKYDLVLVADFGHGIFTDGAISALSDGAKFLAVNTQVNAANVGYHTISRYPRADYVVMNESELRSDARKRVGPVEPLIETMSRHLTCRHVMVTRGKEGTLYRDSASGFFAAPSFALNIVDRTGSGDAVLAVTSAGIVGGMPPEVISFVANVVGAQAVQIVGNRSAIDRAATYKFIDSLLK
jgi:rfaE bifunctional protein nucleotidyltransferase chain/domain